MHILHKFHYLDENRNTIEEHIKVLKNKESVWWGIIGKGLSPERTDIIIDQLDNQIETKVILTSLIKPGNRIFYECILNDILVCEDYCRPDDDDPSEKNFIPEYYEDVTHLTWLLFSDIQNVDNSVMKKYALQSNPKGDLIKPLKGRTPIMYIIKK